MTNIIFTVCFINSNANPHKETFLIELDFRKTTSNEEKKTTS
jgi:hypothetical protein